MRVTYVRADFERFVECELAGLLRYATMLTGDTELARDLVQDVLLKAHTHWDRIATADRPLAYVKTMVVRTHISWRRRWSVRNVVTGYDDALAGPAAPDHAELLAERMGLWDRLGRLPRQ